MLLWSSVSLCGPLMTLTHKKDIRDYLNKKKFNGVILAKSKHRTLWKEAFGVRDIKTRKALTVHDKLLIGSNTKQMIATSLLQLEEEGKLSIDDPISKYIAVPKEYETITIKDILNHTSGIANYTNLDAFWEAFPNNPHITLDEIINFTLKYPLEFKPKSDWNYSNTGYIIAGKILEIQSGLTRDQYLEENIFSPLHMRNTGYSEYLKDVSPVTGHRFQDGKLVSYFPLNNLTWGASAGAIYSTVEDMAKWGRIYSHPKILGTASSIKLITPFLADYALGVHAEKMEDGDTLVSHSGRVPGFVSKLNHLKKKDMTFVSLDNMDGGDLRYPADLLQDFYTKGKVDVIKWQRIEMSDQELAQYEGHFLGKNLDITVYLKDHKLYLFPKGQRPYLMNPIEKDNFDLTYFAEEFLRNAKGEIIAIKHYQDGYISEFKKVSDVIPEVKAPIEKAKALL